MVGFECNERLSCLPKMLVKFSYVLAMTRSTLTILTGSMYMSQDDKDNVKSARTTTHYKVTMLHVHVKIYTKAKFSFLNFSQPLNSTKIFWSSIVSLDLLHRLFPIPCLVFRYFRCSILDKITNPLLNIQINLLKFSFNI